MVEFQPLGGRFPTLNDPAKCLIPAEVVTVPSFSPRGAVPKLPPLLDFAA
jgi:hypothetical protein